MLLDLLIVLLIGLVVSLPMMLLSSNSFTKDLALSLISATCVVGIVVGFMLCMAIIMGKAV